MKKFTVTLSEETASWLEERAKRASQAVSQWLDERLTEMRRGEDDYERAMDQLLAMKPRKLNWIDGRRPTREELYDRPVLRRKR